MTLDVYFVSGIVTSCLFVVSLAIFLVLAARSGTLKSFQSQVSLFIGVYVAGELAELGPVQTATGLPPEIGSELHVLATIIITAVMWSRFVYSNRATRQLADPYDAGIAE